MCQEEKEAAPAPHAPNVNNRLDDGNIYIYDKAPSSSGQAAENSHRMLKLAFPNKKEMFVRLHGAVRGSPQQLLP